MQVQYEHISEGINTGGLIIRVVGATERSLRKMEWLELKENEENIAPIDTDDDDEYDNTDPFVSRMLKKITIFCSVFDESPIVRFVQPCGHTFCTYCVEKKRSITWMSNIQ